MHPLARIGLLLATAAAAAESPSPIPAFFEAHCLKCHGPEKQKGDIRLDGWPGGGDAAFWGNVFAQIDSGDMPPRKETRPEPEAVARVLRQLAAHPSLAPPGPPPLALRRLNRVEYENTVNDLLGTDLRLSELLPEDGKVQGFDTVADGLSLSSVLMERYLEAANAAFDGIIRRFPPQPAETRRLVLMDSSENQESVKQKRAGVIEEARSFVKFTPGWPPVRMDEVHPREDGLFRCRVAVWPHQPGGRTLVAALYTGPLFGPGKQRFIGMFDVTGTAENPRVIEFTSPMKENDTIHIVPWIFPEHVTWRDKHEARPGIAVTWAETHGPLDQAWPSAAQKRLFGDLAMVPGDSVWMRHRKGVRTHRIESPAPAEDLDRFLRAFTPRAFRRPVAEEELVPFLALARGRLEAGRSFEQAARAGFCAVLCAPQFLLLNRGPVVDDHDLAARLSYFLWSSPPDARLLDLAAAGRLRDPATRRQVAAEMLADPKAERFIDNFTGQWLGLRDITFTTPDAKLYPEFDALLQESMLGESRSFFRQVLRDNLGVDRFVRADFTVLNERLARHYGIDGVTGHEHFRVVPLPPGHVRGGVLAQAAVLKVTANGTTSSPVLRGVWVLDRLLARPAPPPPPGVPAVEPDIRGAVTIRQQLDKHQAEESCARCHRRIDPPGFALECFDPIGGLRDRYRVLGGEPAGRKLPYGWGAPVETNGETPDGRPFADFASFRDRLLEDPTVIARALAEKFLVYGVGRPMSAAGLEAVHRVCAEAAPAGYGLRSLLQAVVADPAFVQP